MILVTGGTGFIGSGLVDKLLSQGYSVSVLSRAAPGNGNSKARHIKADITDRQSLAGAFKGSEVVVHLAGMISYSRPREELIKVNSEGTKNVLDACKGVDRFIFSSSVSVYGRIKGVAEENYPAKPMNPYGESKLSAEKFVEESGMDSVMLRIAPVYGKGSPSWMKNLGLLDRGFPVPNTASLTHVVHVSDVVEALALSVEKGNGVYNIADREPIKFVDFAEAVVRLLGKEPRRMPPWLVGLAARAKGMKTYLDVLTANRNYSIAKAVSELGYRPRADFNEKLKEMVEWYKAEPASMSPKAVAGPKG